MESGQKQSAEVEREAEAQGKLKIIHFNDCYSISERNSETCGGIPRFVSLLKSYKQPKLTIFSGDLWSPSIHTSIFNGEQLVDPINACEIDCACLGNHDFDLGLERLQYLNSKCNFPWLLTNLTNLNGLRFASSLPYSYIEKNGYKIGLIGLIEYDWISTLSCLDVEDIIYEDFVSAGERLAAQLKEDYNCDLIIAITHMRLPNDRRLAKLCQEIDLILGGHDHLYAIEQYKDCIVVKSGTDFMNISEINLEKWDGSEVVEQKVHINDDNVVSDEIYSYVIKKKWKVEVVKRDVVRSIEPDQQMLAHNLKYEEKMREQMKVPLFYCDTALETKFAAVRTRETEIGNLFADLMRKEVVAQCSLLNAGCIRSDFSYTQRLFTAGDVQTINPYEQNIMLVEVTARKLLEALENSVSKSPALEGRFCQVSHIKFEWDPTKPPGSRINVSTLKLDGDSYEPEKIYKVAINQYLYSGKDGYDCFKDAKLLTDLETIRNLTEVLFDFFNLAKSTENLDEYRIYSLHKDELTDNFVRLKIQSKFDLMNQMTKRAEKWALDDDSVISKPEEEQPKLRKSLSGRRMDSQEFKDGDDLPIIGGKSISRGEESEGLTVIKLLTRFNVDLLFKRKAILSMDCLIRLRKYQLIVGMEKGPNKQILPVIAPKIENRIVEKSF